MHQQPDKLPEVKDALISLIEEQKMLKDDKFKLDNFFYQFPALNTQLVEAKIIPALASLYRTELGSDARGTKIFWLILVFYSINSEIDNYTKWVDIYTKILDDVIKKQYNFDDFIEFLAQKAKNKKNFWFWFGVLSKIQEDILKIYRISQRIATPEDITKCQEFEYDLAVNLIIKVIKQSPAEADKILTEIFYPIFLLNFEETGFLSSKRAKFIDGSKYNLEKFVLSIQEQDRKVFFQYFMNIAYLNPKNHELLLRLRKLMNIYLRKLGINPVISMLNDSISLYKDDGRVACFIFAVVFDIFAKLSNKSAEYKEAKILLNSCLQFKSEELSNSLISQLSVTFAAIMLNFDKNEYSEYIKSLKTRNSRVKPSEEIMELGNHAMEIYTDPASFDSFMNKYCNIFNINHIPYKESQTILESRFNIHIGKNLSSFSVEKFRNQSIEFLNFLLQNNFHESALPRFIETLLFIETKLGTNISSDRLFIFEKFFHLLNFDIKNPSFETIFRVASLIISATQPTKIPRESQLSWCNAIIKTLQIDEPSKVAITAAHHALYTFFVAIKETKLPEALLKAIIKRVQKYGKREVIESVGIITSLRTLLKDEISISKISKLIDILIDNFDDVSVSTMITILADEVFTDKKVFDETKNQWRKLLKASQTGDVKSLRLLMTLPSMYDELNNYDSEIFDVLIDTIVANTQRVTDDAYFRMIMDIIHETCLKSKNLEKFARALMKMIPNSSEERRKTLESCIHKFVLRFNQEFGFCSPIEGEHNAIAVINNETVIGLKGMDDHRFRAFSKSTYSADCFDVEQILNNPDENEQNNVEIAPRDEVIVHHKEFDDNMSDYINMLSELGTSETESKPAHIVTNKIDDLKFDPYFFENLPQRESRKTEGHIIHEMPAAFSLLCSLLGTLTEENLGFSETEHLLEIAEKNSRSISPRDNFKIGLVFVAKGQIDQNDILKNSWCDESVTDRYKSFVRSMGNIVDLSKHHYFNGKMDVTNFSNGRYHCFYSNECFEVMFHTSTLMPTDEKDNQQIYKKRHIGNDNINVIWSENEYDYNPMTISSQFNDAHVIIYPITDSEDTFRVSIFRKKKEMSFGPLISEHVVSAKVLPFLVRWTAIFADKEARQAAQYISPSIEFINSLKYIMNSMNGKKN